MDVEASKIGSILTLLIVAGRTDAATTAVSRFGAAAVLKTVAAVYQSEHVADLATWLRAVVRQPAEVGGVLATDGIPRRIVIELSKLMAPDDLPNDFGEDPWAVASESEGLIEPADEVRFAGFLLARALGNRSRSCAKLFAVSFERVHKALASNEMTDDTWRQIDRKLGWVYPWMEWDRCGRVRQAVVDKFVDMGLDPGTFGRLASDQSLLAEIIELASMSGRGRRYLDLVRQSVQNRPENLM